MKIQFLVEWSEQVKNMTGLPRPFVKYGKGTNRPTIKNKLARKTPFPWQSKPIPFTDGIQLIPENEQRVYAEKLCAYCGVQFNPKEECVIWTTKDKPVVKHGRRVYSDYHPFHLECMRQARIFCPHMRTTEDKEFQTGIYEELRIEAIKRIL
jgi:hypothetical protein